jgi:hypothetical protein
MLDGELLSCGSPGVMLKSPDDEEYQPQRLGCWCFMPIKAMAAEANCWLWEECGGEYIPMAGGWKDELNGDYEQRTVESKQ